MSVITEFRLPSNEFELGRILDLDDVSAIELETLVPTGEVTVPLFWLHDPGRGCLDAIERHPVVNSATVVDSFEDRSLLRLDWDASRDELFQCLLASEGQILSATGTPEAWEFEVRFPGREALGRYRDCCTAEGLALDITRVYNPSVPEAGPWYGLTEPQREALALAVRMGYYDIPRGCTTVALAEELGISDQAVTERLRRAISVLGRNTLLALEPDD